MEEDPNAADPYQQMRAPMDWAEAETFRQFEEILNPPMPENLKRNMAMTTKTYL